MATKDGVAKRSILWFLVFLGCGVNYMIRTNINIAIVAMVKIRDSADSTAIVSECFEADHSHDNNYTATNNSSFQQDIMDDMNRFDWDEHMQNMIMGSFFWLYWSAQVPGGLLAQRYGTKKVFGLGNFFISATTFLIPLFASIDYRLLVVLRVLQGVSGGLCWPALNCIISQWVPPNERSKFLSAYMGSSVGAALTFPLCGMIIHFINWQAAFYITGGLGVLWFISWWIMVYDKPDHHPTISQSELKYIQSSLGDTISKEKLPIPWKSILLSRPLWINIGLSWGCIWGLFTILMQAPTYFQNIHGWNIRMVGFMSGLPYLTRMCLAIGTGYLCDYLRASGKLSVTNVRKLAGIISNTLQGIFMLGLAFSGCNSIAAAIFLSAALSMSGAEPSASLATYIDLSPNFSALLMGIGNMICVTPGFVSSAIVGFLTYQNQTTEQWRKVFLVSSAVLLVPAIIHLVFASAELQEWNHPKSSVKGLKIKDVEKDEESQQPLTAEPTKHKTDDNEQK